MPATALRHPDEEEIVLPVSPPSSTSTPPTPSTTTDPHNLEWRTVAPYVDHFSETNAHTDRAERRRHSRRHRPFILSSAFLAGTLVFVELMGLVSTYAVELKAIRQDTALSKQIQETNLQIALAQNKLASYKSSPLLTQWATQLGYRPIEAQDFDDVTSNAPVPAPPKPEHKP